LLLLLVVVVLVLQLQPLQLLLLLLLLGARRECGVAFDSPSCPQACILPSFWLR
jgi:hypothetical protein